MCHQMTVLRASLAYTSASGFYAVLHVLINRVCDPDFDCLLFFLSSLLVLIYSSCPSQTPNLVTALIFALLWYLCQRNHVETHACD